MGLLIIMAYVFVVFDVVLTRIGLINGAIIAEANPLMVAVLGCSFRTFGLLAFIGVCMWWTHVVRNQVRPALIYWGYGAVVVSRVAVLVYHAVGLWMEGVV